MHPYYGSTSLYGASPTPIESVEAQENQMNATPSQTQGIGTNNTPDLGNGDLNMQPTNNHLYGYISGSQGMPDVVPVPTQNAGQVLDLDIQPSSQPIASSSYYPQYQPTPVSSQHEAFNYASRPVISRNLPLMAVPTSTHCVQFASPSITNSYCSQTLTSHVPVSFHFSSPTFSSPPVQMMAPKSESRRQPWHLTVPTSMPWASPGPIQSASIQFTAALGSTSCTSSMASSGLMSSDMGNRKHTKRKSSLSDGGIPEKVHINEEKMAARLEEMHLDNNNLQWHPDLEEQWYTQKQETSTSRNKGNRSGQNDETEEMNSAPSITVSQCQKIGGSTHLNFSEILKIGMKSKEILPKVIMEEINKPNMQIVLWKPPGDFVRHVVNEVTKSDQQPNSEVIDISDSMIDLGVTKNNTDHMDQPLLPPLGQYSWIAPSGEDENGDGSNDMEL